MDRFCYLCLSVILSCLCFTALKSPAGKGWPLGSLVCDVFWGVFVTLPYDVLGQVWHLIVSVPDLCLLYYCYTDQWY